jgi:hypothetical protein
MNILQAACYFSSEAIVNHVKDKFRGDAEGLRELCEYQEPFGGNMAIHFAVLKGNKRIIDVVVRDFKADPTALT